MMTNLTSILKKKTFEEDVANFEEGWQMLMCVNIANGWILQSCCTIASTDYIKSDTTTISHATCKKNDFFLAALPYDSLSGFTW